MSAARSHGGHSTARCCMGEEARPLLASFAMPAARHMKKDSLLAARPHGEGSVARSHGARCSPAWSSLLACFSSPQYRCSRGGTPVLAGEDSTARQRGFRCPPQRIPVPATEDSGAHQGRFAAASSHAATRGRPPFIARDRTPRPSLAPVHYPLLAVHTPSVACHYARSPARGELSQPLLAWRGRRLLAMYAPYPQPRRACVASTARRHGGSATHYESFHYPNASRLCSSMVRVEEAFAATDRQPPGAAARRVGEKKRMPLLVGGR
ncbi:hypothetical protein Dimus_006518 [Dionaea muscipula]